MNTKLISALDRVLEMNRQKLIAADRIRETTYQQIGRVIVPLERKAREKKIDTLNRLFRDNAKSVYDTLNEGRLERGLPMLKNPYVKVEKEYES